jgi:hypothetical protein
MASELAVTPAEYRGDLRLGILPDRLRVVSSVAAMITIFVLAIVIDLIWKRTHGTALSLPPGEVAASAAT